MKKILDKVKTKVLEGINLLAAAMVSTTYVPIDINNPKERITCQGSYVLLERDLQRNM